MGEVLRRAAQHRRPADVDHLDRLLLADAVLPRDLLERVQVDADEVEQLDPVLGERGEVGLDLAAGEDAGMDSGMEGLDAAAEHLGELGQVLDVRHRQAELADRVGGAPACDELPVERREPLRKVSRGLVEDGVQPHAAALAVEAGTRKDHAARAAQRALTSYARRQQRRCPTRRGIRSTISPSPRARRRGSVDQRLARLGTGSWRITGPLSSPSSTRCTVTPVVSTPAARASSIARAPGKSGSSEGWTLTIRSGSGRGTRP